jgi:hypothetical protein
MAGFAAINAGGAMQQLEIFACYPVVSLLPIVLNQCFMLATFRAFQNIHGFLLELNVRDGIPLIRADMFDEQTIESENEISSLAGSFMLVQALRFVLVGKLPSLRGESEVPGIGTIVILYIFGLAFWFSMGALVKTKSLVLKDEDIESKEARVMDCLITGSGMSFAWCFLFSSRWMFDSCQALNESGIGMNTVAGRILLALMVSIFCGIIIWFLDVIDDHFKKGLQHGQINRGAELTRQIVRAKSLLAGFSWENAFDIGAAVLASKTSNPLLSQSVIAIFVFLAIVPAWQQHILIKVYQLELYYLRQQEADLKERPLPIKDP